MSDWREANIKFEVCSSSSEESNLFLRRFYEELYKFGKIGWYFQTYRIGRIIYVGKMNYGDMWISYKERGKLDCIYIKTDSDESKNLVYQALVNARNSQAKFTIYNITVVFDTYDIEFCDMKKNGIWINSEKFDNRIWTKISFSIKAFGPHDLEYIKIQKINHLKHLFCSYTNILFECIKIICNEGELNILDNTWEEPDSDWIEIEDLFVDRDKKVASLCFSFFDILRNIFDVFEYDKNIRLLLNASQEIYCSKKMINNLLDNGKEWNMPCYTDLVNTLIISSLEPLSSIYGIEPETCYKCGNLKYSIRRKIKDLCDRYCPPNVVQEIFNDRYKERSSFLHEGNPITNEFYCGHCVPLLDPVDGRSIMLPVSTVNINMFDYVAYIFRHIAAEVCCDIIPKENSDHK